MLCVTFLQLLLIFFSLLLVFRYYDTCFTVALFVFSLPEFTGFLDSLSFSFSLNLEDLLSFLKYFSCCLITDILDIFILFYRSLRKLLIVSVAMPAHSMIFSSAVSNLLLFTTNKIFIQKLYFLISKIFMYILYISHLNPHYKFISILF